MPLHLPLLQVFACHSLGGGTPSACRLPCCKCKSLRCLLQCGATQILRLLRDRQGDKQNDRNVVRNLPIQSFRGREELQRMPVAALSVRSHLATNFCNCALARAVICLRCEAESSGQQPGDCSASRLRAGCSHNAAMFWADCSVVCRSSSVRWASNTSTSS